MSFAELGREETITGTSLFYNLHFHTNTRAATYHLAIRGECANRIFTTIHLC